MIGKGDARALRALANILRDAPDNPRLVLHVAEALEAFVTERATTSSGDERQLELVSPSSSMELMEPSPSSMEQPRSSAEPAPSAAPMAHQALRPVESVPSSSSDLLNNQEKKRGRFTLDSDAELTDELRAVYTAVATERLPAKLPSAEYLWGKFVEHVVDERKTWAKPWNIKRAYRQFCEREWPLALESAPPPAPASERRVAPRVPDAEQTRREQDARVREEQLLTHETRVELAHAMLADFQRSQQLPPEPRSMSA